MECDRCTQEIHTFFTIPLDENWIRTSGAYCSRDCALIDNEFVNRPLRGVEGAEQRAAWFKQDCGPGEDVIEEKRQK